MMRCCPLTMHRSLNLRNKRKHRWYLSNVNASYAPLIILPIVIDRFRNPPKQGSIACNCRSARIGSRIQAPSQHTCISFEWVSCAIRRWPSLYLAMALHLLDNLHIKLGASRYFITITDTKTDKRHDTLLLQSQFFTIYCLRHPMPTLQSLPDTVSL